MTKPHEEIMVPSHMDGTGVRWQLMCPGCGTQNVENANYAPDHEVISVQPDRDEYDSPIGTRGGYVSVDLECDAGHSFALVVGNHKGAEFVGVVPRGGQG
ncbi:hypothetical protein [Streptomyces sp. st140]|uniref:hypothetical protein n=1 Tax=Streptomyces sp. st140 TaxID=1828052 RepID=UPI000BF06C7F|nr:hypothetical protein [Streptomyces sp. st140]